MKTTGKDLHQYILVTPTQAKQWLDATDGGNFRKLSEMHVARLCDMMRNGEWKYSAAPIIIDASDGSIIDGQHRMAALVMYGKPLEFLVIRTSDRAGIEPYIDTTHMNRTTAQYVARLGFANSHVVSSGIRVYIRWVRGIRDTTLVSGSHGLRGVTPKMIGDAVTENGPTLNIIAAPCRTMWPYVQASHAVCVGLDAINRGVPSEKFLEFAGHVASGDSLPKHHPALTLRNSMNTRTGKVSAPFNNLRAISNLILAWNAFIEDRQIQKMNAGVSIAKSGQAPEISCGAFQR